MEEKNKKTFKELWANTRTRALIKLGMWFSFFILIFLVLGIVSIFNNNNQSQEQTKKEEVVTANISTMIENLISCNYTFEYKIVSGDIQYSYTGSKENKEEKGYYESSNDIIKYIIKDNVYYELNNNELIENNEIINEEDKNILNLNNILSIIKKYELENEALKEGNEYIYNVVNNDINYQIKIITKNSDIQSIVIDYDNINYNLTFKNIENVTE